MPININEFYASGISLSKDQWNKLKEQISEIDDAVKDLS
jgi:hypothetical protein